MKAQIASVLQTIHGQTRQRQSEMQIRSLQSQNSQLERTLREKERELNSLQQELTNLEARLQELMGIDVLTGLPNRHIFKEHLTHSLKRALRLGYSLSIMLIDIDHLREINLEHGCEIGDNVLVEVAQILRSSVREVDMPARWGGEELVAVLHETDTEGAAMVAERVRKKVEALAITDSKTGSLVQVTATLSVSSYPLHSHEVHGLLEVASEALITAKERGCNSVIIAKR